MWVVLKVGPLLCCGVSVEVGCSGSKSLPSQVSAIHDAQPVPGIVGCQTYCLSGSFELPRVLLHNFEIQKTGTVVDWLIFNSTDGVESQERLTSQGSIFICYDLQYSGISLSYKRDTSRTDALNASWCAEFRVNFSDESVLTFHMVTNLDIGSSLNLARGIKIDINNKWLSLIHI